MKEQAQNYKVSGLSPNRRYKDRLFCYIFGAEENRKYLLSLYNAINHTEYADAGDIEITTLEDVIYIRMKNDVSFILDSELNLYEHQSTFNPNMPLRGMMYFSSLYMQYLTVIKKDLYGTTLVKIPTPRYYVFYNGEREYPDRMELKLSDAFDKPDDTGDFEWTAVMLNINQGRNKDLLEKCRALREYSDYVAMVRENHKTMSINEAIDKAVDSAIKKNYLNGFFKKHKEGVAGMSLTEYNEAEFVANRLEEGIAEGENLMSSLIRLLLKDNRNSDIELAATDKDARKRLYKEYGLMQ